MSDEPETLPGTDVQTPATREPQPTTSDDPAAAAFEALREEVALVRRAVAGLAAERGTIPDYSETLGQILQASTVSARRLKALAEFPAFRLTPEIIGRQINDAAQTARRSDHAMMAEASAAVRQVTQELTVQLQFARTAKTQRIWLVATGIMGLVAGMALWAAVTRFPTLPIDHRSPEEKAAAILGKDQLAAGEHLIQTAAPQLWQDLVLGDRIVHANREALDVCRRKSSKQRIRCVITMPTAEP